MGAEPGKRISRIAQASIHCCVLNENPLRRVFYCGKAQRFGRMIINIAETSIPPAFS